MTDAVSMLKLQADLINSECRVLYMAVAVCESNNLPETARSLRLTITILREAATLIKREADHLEDQEIMSLEDLIDFDPADNGNQGS